MKDILINQIIIPLLIIAIGTILELVRRQLKSYLNSNEELIDKQKEAIKQSMGIEQYNKDKQDLIDVIEAVEQLGKEFNWEGAVKHSKVLEFIKGNTGLSDEEVFNIIKSTVLKINKPKNNITTINNTQE